ncbi:KPN_02809 family neutral zinc metallopeptidase [Crenobacter caeni]|uniref:Metalloprotease n=1 Tax=Crenobacter caeni TaxID=2705474 RepID=A0A6B2KS36_9NEIS|nr:neutral zinc metallopeptidase [Crenobacter caeni]NDV12944.1 metalloprotease [Crenobacter caeni]
MQWKDRRASDNVEDRRGLGRAPRLGGRIGIGTIVIALVAWWLFDVNPLAVLDLAGSGAPATEQQVPAQAPPAKDEQARFASVILADTEDIWQKQFADAGQTYRAPLLVLFAGSTPTACGEGQSAMGPFYCPLDGKVYLDLDFFRTLHEELGAPGDFAQAYVIAHEVGHHVQNLLGVSEKVRALRSRMDEAGANALSVRQELQADCLAGVWAHHAGGARSMLETGDLEEGLNAAARIGDDTLQRSAGRAVVPDSFTHGTSEQRVRWFSRGFDSGDMRGCDTFAAKTL